jgi:cell division septum initiation protein DivIVA
MSQPEHHFRVVLRGYDPTDVDRVLTDLDGRVATAEQEAQGLRAKLQEAQAEAASKRETAEDAPVPVASVEHLGARVGQILGLAEEEAAELRDAARAELEALRKDAEQAAVAVRDEADRYADQRRRDADHESSRVLTDARRAADEERDAAERDASARRQEAEAIYEEQRANAARAAADFEATLAERRDRTTAEFQEQQAATQAQLDAMLARVSDTREAADRQKAVAEADARRIVEEAEARAAALVKEARAAADRVRADSDRELAAASQRRDSINAQLSNVRQMLQTLSGAAVAGPALDVELHDEVEEDADDAPAPEGEQEPAAG